MKKRIISLAAAAVFVLEHLPDAEIAAHRQQTKQHPPMHLHPVEIW